MAIGRLEQQQLSQRSRRAVAVVVAMRRLQLYIAALLSPHNSHDTSTVDT